MRRHVAEFSSIITFTALTGGQFSICPNFSSVVVLAVPSSPRVVNSNQDSMRTLGFSLKAKID